jgi:uroporphyrinogen-III synthase
LKVSPSGARQIFYFFKALHADKQATSVGVVTKRLAPQQKIAMFNFEKRKHK